MCSESQLNAQGVNATLAFSNLEYVFLLLKLKSYKHIQSLAHQHPQQQTRFRVFLDD